jgi:glycosyltransferase involved in cell wall biosynthesis
MFSIIIPVYKVEQYLRRCIESVLNQTYVDFEMILVDDGSPDNCGVICEEYALLDNRIRVIHQNNKGLSEARNSGLKIAKGEYILFADSDDYVDIDWIQSFLPFVSNKHDNFVFGGFISQRNEEEVFVYDSIEANQYSVDEFVRLHIESKAGFACNTLYYRDVIIDNNLKFSRDVVVEDLPFNLEYLKYMNYLNFTGESHYHYVQYSHETLSKKYFPDGYRKWQEKFSALINFINEKAESQEYLKREVATYYLYHFLNSLNNTFDSRNNKNLFLKILYNSAVVNSSEFQMCLQYADASNENGKYINLLRHKKYLTAFIYQGVATFKNKVINRIGEFN